MGHAPYLPFAGKLFSTVITLNAQRYFQEAKITLKNNVEKKQR